MDSPLLPPLPSAASSRLFAVRIVALDYYMARPLPGVDACFSHQEGSAIDQVPVIRIFGSTPSGQKTCLHLHGVRKRRAMYACILRALAVLPPQSSSAPGCNFRKLIGLMQSAAPTFAL